MASVGEDIEARVDFLTQDKARLAADVLQYNNKISRWVNILYNVIYIYMCTVDTVQQQKIKVGY